MHKLLKFFLAVMMSFLVIVSFGSAVAEYLKASTSKTQLAALKLPPDFSISVFAGHLQQKLSGARLMAVGPDGNLYLTLPTQNKVVMLPDTNHDGVADSVITVAEKGLNAPHGLAFVENTLYIANQDSVVRLEQKNRQWPAVGVTPIIQNLATGGHTLKSLKLGPDGHFYLNVGSSCNVCVEEDSARATMLRYTVEGKPAGALVTLGQHAQSAIWASGLRNSQGFAWHPVTNDMFATNEGADNRSEFKRGKVNDEIPPEHLNKIEAGKHYGWPYCWGKLENGHQFSDPNFVADADFCNTTQAPAITFTSHSTPIGIAFLANANVPEAFKKDAIVALHGSWNRQKLSGYQLVHVKFNEVHQPIAVEDFATGWLENNQAWGRPVDVVVGQDRAIYVSDDKMGLIYRIQYQAP